MIAKLDIVILSTSSALLLIALLRLDSAPANSGSLTYYTSSNRGVSKTPLAETTVSNIPTDKITSETVAPTDAPTEVVGTTPVTEVVIEPEVTTTSDEDNFKEPDVIREAAFTTHVVKQGEYLGLIARRYNTTVSELKRLKNLNGNIILVGQELVYPSK